MIAALNSNLTPVMGAAYKPEVRQAITVMVRLAVFSGGGNGSKTKPAREGFSCPALPKQQRYGTGKYADGYSQFCRNSLPNKSARRQWTTPA